MTTPEPTDYRTVDDWLYEIESFGIRAERVPVDALPWVKTAWSLATEAEQRRWVEAVNAMADDASQPEAVRTALRHLVSTLGAL